MHNVSKHAAFLLNFLEGNKSFIARTKHQNNPKKQKAKAAANENPFDQSERWSESSKNRGHAWISSYHQCGADIFQKIKEDTSQRYEVQRPPGISLGH